MAEKPEKDSGLKKVTVYAIVAVATLMFLWALVMSTLGAFAMLTDPSFAYVVIFGAGVGGVICFAIAWVVSY